MRLAMAQMAMTDNIDENADRALAYYDQAGEAGADLLFFPEIQFSPFFPSMRTAMRRDISWT
ncbi:MAG: nitrilase-related carbon-nitrogen hydrolase [Bifidobacterium bifidum]